MLDKLFGGKTMSKVLIFLFVNGKCYGTQLHKSLKTALTPIQKALNRMEEAGVVTSFYEGKTRLYQFNPSYPLLGELEALLKKAYTLLPPQEKKSYCLIKQEFRKRGANQESQDPLMTIWKRLGAVKSLTFHANTKSKEEGGWNGKGSGEVIVEREGQNVMIFTERGSWNHEDGREIDFRNVFRWTLDRSTRVISLEHLRRGVHHPVFLFHLAPSGSSSLASVDSHLCEGDAYFGQVLCDPHHLRLNWRVIGPKKNEEIDYYYL